MPTRLAVTLLLLGSVFAPPATPAQTFSPPEEPRHYMPERGYDLRHLRLDLAFDWEKKEVSGTATNTLAPLRSGLDHLEFHAVDLVVTRVRLRAASAPVKEPGEELPFSLDPAAQTLTVHLGHPHAPGEVLEVAIDYTAHPRTGLYFVGPDAAYPAKPRQIFSQGEPDLNRHWFPSWDAPNDRATSELFATVKKPFQVIGNGALIEVLDRPDGTRTFHWRMDQPHPTYLTSVVVGDFARVADAWQGVPVEYYVPPGREADARAALGRTPEMMGYFVELTGRAYPFAKYAQSFVYDFPWGGMENVSATTETERALHPADQDADFSSDDLVSHELAHQWFGDLISCRSWDQAWLSEGFADYFAALWDGHAHGADAFAVAIDKLREGYLAEAEGDYRRPIVTLRYSDPIRMFDAHSYEKGALVLHMVRSLVGEDAWWRGLREYVRRYAGQTVTTADFQSVMEEVSGVPLGPVIDQYVLGAGHPELEVRWEWRPETRQVHVTVEQRQRITEEIGFFSFPVEIALLGEHGTEVIERVDLEARRHQDIDLPSETRPRTVVFDPHGWMLKTLDFHKPLDEWIVQLDNAPEPEAKLDAIRALGALGGGMARGEAEAALGRILHGTAFQGLRRAAADALGALGTDAALHELQAALATSTAEPDSRVRTAVLAALKKFPKHPELIPLLGRALEADRSFAARAAAAGALGAFRAERKEVAPLLVRALTQKSPRDLVLAVSLTALAELDAPQTVEEAERYARYGAPDGARGRAMLALARYTARQKDAKMKEDVRLVLEGYLDDPVYRIRREVYSAFAALGDPAAIPALERSARNEVDGEQRGKAEEALHALRTAKGGGDAVAGDLAGRVEQLERESDVLKARIEELEGKH
ncbi:MAG TPA: M1 family metallopeptidase [Thermoanaerobaculia bacterium]|jgi:aminopeptidase N|nr:M1 family metallopeptidase [Thermoanaerobaculia bacterium]